MNSSPSKINVSSNSKNPRTTKRDINASRSRAFGASSVSNSSRKVAGTGQTGSTHGTRVYLEGVDVTPQSLLLSRIKPSTPTYDHRHQKGKGRSGRSKGISNSRTGAGGNSTMGASVIFSNASSSSLDNDSDSESTVSAVAPTSGAKTIAKAIKSGVNSVSAPGVAAPIAVSAPQSVSASLTVTRSEDDVVRGDGPETTDSATTSIMVADGDSKPTATAASTMKGTVDTTTMKQERQQMKRHPVTIQLVETPTMMMFELKSVCVGADATYHQAVVARNKKYLEICAQKRGSDKYIEGRSQTLQLAQKAKEVMTAPPATRDAMCVATDWDIFDCAKIEDETMNEHDDSMDSSTKPPSKAPIEGGGGVEFGEIQLKHQVEEIVDATMASSGCILDVDGDIVADLRARQHAARSRKVGKHHFQGTTSSSSNNTINKSRARISGNVNQSQQDIGRSTANALMGNSSSSMASPSQSGANLSIAASQDGAGSMEDSSNSATRNSQVGASSASRGVISGGAGNSDDGNKLNPYARANTNVDIGEIIAQQRTTKVLSSTSLQKTVSILERAVQQNVYHAQHVLYRNFPVLAMTTGSGVSKQHKKVNSEDLNEWQTGGPSFSNDVSVVVPPFSSFPNGSIRSAGSSVRKESLEKLWVFQCELTTNKRVSCLAWNTVNEDLLAVSYVSSKAVPTKEPTIGANHVMSNTNGAIPVGGGYAVANSAAMATSAISSTGAAVASTSTEIADQNEGLILFWSLKNPEYPERIYNLNVGVTSIDFSRTHPYLLAVGFADGAVAIYDTRKDTSSSTDRSDAASSSLTRHLPTPIASSEISNGKHLDAVWQVQWITKGSDRGENVVSISSDGRVTEWSMKRGLSFSDLMALKRVTNPLLGSDARADGVISRQASGQCIAFATNDSSVYFVGTEDGMIHKCSASYNEQYLQTYIGHTGPVYEILVSPFCSDLFLSCSADWNVKLWHQNEAKELLNFRSVDLVHAVHSISWCPRAATIFSAVAEDGRIEIWDLQQSILDPIITHFPKKYAIVTPPPPVAGTNINGTGGSGNGTNEDGALDDDMGDVTGLPVANKAGDTTTASDIPPQEIPLECTNIAFAPSAPVIVVGDSTGDVTVYRVPSLAEGRGDLENMTADDQLLRLQRAINPNKHE